MNRLLPHITLFSAPRLTPFKIPAMGHKPRPRFVIPAQAAPLAFPGTTQTGQMVLIMNEYPCIFLKNVIPQLLYLASL